MHRHQTHLGSSATCLSCAGTSVLTLLNFGPQPPSNRFLPVGIKCDDAHPLILGQCVSCGLIQLMDFMQTGMVRSPHTWLRYNEPEGHLDKLVEHLSELAGINAQSSIVGLTYKDDSTLARFNRLGYSKTLRYDVKADLGVDDPCAGLETVQAIFDDDLADRLAAVHGKADLLIARHILEHAHCPGRFLKTLGRLLAPGGRLLLEMPDCTKFVAACDYSFIWEEHICYFSRRTVADLAQVNDFIAKEILVYPYPLEDSLVTILQARAGAPNGHSPDDKPSALEAGRRFGSEYELVQRRYRLHFDGLRAAGKKVAIFGAGHLAAKFINLLRLPDCFACVIDDNPRKLGLSMPGSGLPILGSSELREIDLCMLSLSPESEQKVLASRQDYLSRGGQFASIFALSPLALKLG